MPQLGPCAVLYFGLGSAFLPGHAAWCTLLLWVAALIGGLVAYMVSFGGRLWCSC